MIKVILGINSNGDWEVAGSRRWTPGEAENCVREQLGSNFRLRLYKLEFDLPELPVAVESRPITAKVVDR